MDSLTPEEIKKFLDNIGAIKNTVEGTDKKIDKLSSDLNTLKKENKDMKKEIKALKIEVESLKIKMNNLDQYSRKNNIIIANVPHQNNENIYELVINVLNSLDMKMNDGDFGTIHRLRATEGKIPSIIARLTNSDKKNEIIKKAKRYKLHGKKFGFNPALPIYISEQLTKNTLEILNRAKKLRNQNIIKYVWSRDGTIFIRKDDQDPAIKIEDISQLQDNEESYESSEDDYETENHTTGETKDDLEKNTESKSERINLDKNTESISYKDRMRPRTFRNDQSSKPSSSRNIKNTNKVNVK